MQDIVLDSRHGRQTNVIGRFGSFLKSVLLALILGLLFGLDFVLYLRSGTVQLFDGVWNTSVFMVLTGIVVGVLAAMLLLFFSRSLQKMLFAFGCAALVWGIFCQFLQIDKAQYLGVLLSPLLGTDIAVLTDGYSHLIICGVVFVLAYIISGKLSKTSMAYLIGSLILVIGVFFVAEMFDTNKNPTFKEVYKTADNSFSEKNKKVVFLFLPNMASFSAINAGSGNDLEKNNLLRNVELGFFMKNGFKLYSNAYVPNENKDANLVELLNILDEKPYFEHILNSAGLENLWKFKSPQRTDVFLQDNQMQDVFRKAGYKLSAYQSQNIEICKKNNQYTVDRCINEQSMPVDVNGVKFSELDKASLLFKQWMNSLGLVGNDTVAGVLQYVLDKQTLQNVFLPYERMYVVNSLRVLQTVLENISSDKGAGVYFVYLNFPDNLLIYDEYCNIKPQSKWNSLTPSVKLPMISRNTKEYNEQMLCLFGQLEEFMNGLKELKPEDNITVILQGLSGKKSDTAPNLNFVEKFKEQNMVMTAIHDGNPHFGISHKICNSKDILRSYLFKIRSCDEFSGIKISDGTQETLRGALKKVRVSKDMLSEAENVYDNWQKQWQENKKLSVIIKKKAAIEQLKVQATEETKDPDALQSEMAVRALIDSLNNETFPEKTGNKDNELKVDTENTSNPEIKTEVEDVPLERTDENEHNRKTETETKQPQAVENDVLEVEQNKADEKTSEAKDMKPATSEPKEAVVAEETVKVSKPEVMPKIKETSKAEKTEEKAEDKPTAPQAVEVEPMLKTGKAPIQAKETLADKAPTAAEQSKAVAVETVIEKDTTPDKTTDTSADFLLEDEEDEWELDPAKALGVSGDEQKPEEKIIVKVK